MSDLDYQLSLEVARLIRAQKHRCWYNARDALAQLPALFLLAWYVEGWVVVPTEQEIQVIEHGWVEYRGGRIVDPSIVLLIGEDQHIDSFPGIKLSRLLMQEVPLDLILPLARLVSQSNDGLGHPDYKAAYDATLARAEQFALTLRKPVQVYQRVIRITITFG